MFDFVQPAPQADPALIIARQFFSRYGRQPVEPAQLLGGEAAQSRAVACRKRLASACSVGAQTRRDLVVLHRLLSLQDVGHPDRIETDLFATLHPASHEVERICALTNRLADLLAALGEAGAAPASPDRRSERRWPPLDLPRGIEP